MRSKRETVLPRLSGTGTNALPIAAYAVAAGMAYEHSALRDVSKFLQDAYGTAKRTNALAARIGNDEDFFCKRAHERRDHGAVSPRLGFI